MLGCTFLAPSPQKALRLEQMVEINAFKDQTRDVEPDVIRNLFKNPGEVIQIGSDLGWSGPQIADVLSRLGTNETGPYLLTLMEEMISNLRK